MMRTVTHMFSSWKSRDGSTHLDENIAKVSDCLKQGFFHTHSDH